MRIAAALAALALGCASVSARAQDEERWDFVATGYWNSPKSADDFASGIFTADRGALHLEARANYEAVHAQSAFVGWSFSWGDEVKLEATPIVGGVTGTARGPIAGLEATLSAGRFDYYLEAEHVRDREGGTYNYAWAELGFKPAEWARLGVVGQRTRVYGSERETQRGGFVQLVKDRWTLGLYWFNPGSSEQVVIGALGVAF